MEPMQFDTVDEYLDWRLRSYAAVCASVGASAPSVDAWGFEARDTRSGELTVTVSGPFDSFFGVNVNEIIAAIGQRPKLKALRLLIDSPGGVANDGFKFRSHLAKLSKDGVKIITEAMGIVASAAVMPYMAGQDRIMRTGSQLMIHEVWALLLAAGPPRVLQAAVDKISVPMKNMTEDYAKVVAASSGMDLDAVTAAMVAETWYSSEEALGNGMATEIEKLDLSDKAKAESEMVRRAKAAYIERFISRGGFNA